MKPIEKKYYKYFSTNSILYIDKTGTLKRLYCPFLVKAKLDIPPIKTDAIVVVEAIKITRFGMDVYIIDGKGYFVIYFRLI